MPRVFVREITKDVVLEIGGEDHSTWQLCDSVVLKSGKNDYISFSVAQQMVNIAYDTGADRAVKQLAKIRDILEG